MKRSSLERESNLRLVEERQPPRPVIRDVDGVEATPALLAVMPSFRKGSERIFLNADVDLVILKMN